MKTSHEMIIAMFQRSVFALTFETEDILGYRSGPQGKVLRALSINVEQRTVEYELTERGLPTKRRVEYSPSLAHLVKKLPLTADAFDLKFQSVRLTEQGASVAEPRGRVSFTGTQDPWDLTNCFEKSRTGKPEENGGLRPMDEKLK